MVQIGLDAIGKHTMSLSQNTHESPVDESTKQWSANDQHLLPANLGGMSAVQSDNCQGHFRPGLLPSSIGNPIRRRMESKSVRSAVIGLSRSEQFRCAIEARSGKAPVDMCPGRWIEFTAGKRDDAQWYCRLDKSQESGVFGCPASGEQHQWSHQEVLHLNFDSATLTEYPTFTLPNIDPTARDRMLMERTLERSDPVRPGDPVYRFLKGRLGSEWICVPSSVRFHPALPYWYREVFKGYLPAMVVPLTSSSGANVALECTYLTSNGELAQVPIATRRFAVCGDLKGSWLNLGDDVGSVIGIARDVASCMAANLGFGIPTIGIRSAAYLRDYKLPETVTRVVFFAGDDPTWLQAAHAFANRSSKRGLSGCVFESGAHGGDWTDFYQAYQTAKARREVAV